MIFGYKMCLKTTILLLLYCCCVKMIILRALSSEKRGDREKMRRKNRWKSNESIVEYIIILRGNRAGKCTDTLDFILSWHNGTHVMFQWNKRIDSKCNGLPKYHIHHNEPIYTLEILVLRRQREKKQPSTRKSICISKSSIP